MATDRELTKNRQEGTYSSFGLSNPSTAVRAEHSRQRDFTKTGSENAATNVAEGNVFSVERKSALRAVALHESANIAADTSDFILWKVYKRTGETQTLIASYNSHTSAQGAVTRWTQEEFSVNTTSDANVIDAGSVITHEILKFGSGKAVSALTVLSFDLEEV